MNPHIDSSGTPVPQDVTRVNVPHGPHLNALKHGLRSAAVLLPGDDAEEFERMRRELYALHRPGTGNEARCVDAMADHEWCMERCRRWRRIYHGQLDALLLGEPDGAGGAHCERDPHRWHHSAMDCALEEGRLGRLQDRERRKLAELQKLRRQNLLAGLMREAEREGALLFQDALVTGSGRVGAHGDAPSPQTMSETLPRHPRSNACQPADHSMVGAHGAAPARTAAATPSHSPHGAIGKNPERGEPALPGGDARAAGLERGMVEMSGGDARPGGPERVAGRAVDRMPGVRPVELPPNFRLRERGPLAWSAVSSA